MANLPEAQPASLNRQMERHDNDRWDQFQTQKARSPRNQAKPAKPWKKLQQEFCWNLSRELTSPKPKVRPSVKGMVARQPCHIYIPPQTHPQTYPPTKAVVRIILAPYRAYRDIWIQAWAMSRLKDLNPKTNFDFNPSNSSLVIVENVG